MSEHAINPDRPSRHGAIFGEALAAIAAEGFKRLPELQAPPREMCATCAFRPGCPRADYQNLSKGYAPMIDPVLWRKRHGGG